MIDQCNHCDNKGNLNDCLKADCNLHESWYAKEQQKQIERLKKAWDTSTLQALENGHAAMNAQTRIDNLEKALLEAADVLGSQASYIGNRHKVYRSIAKEGKS